jgi:hypothetical protein
MGEELTAISTANSFFEISGNFEDNVFENAIESLTVDSLDGLRSSPKAIAYDTVK